MSAARYDLVIDQGSDFAIEFTVSTSGVAKNLTGYSARAQLRPSKSSSSLSATFTCGIPTPTNGKVTMALPYSASTGLTAGRFFYDLEIYTSSGSLVSRLLYGEVTLTQEVTR
jgi:hypothetical protein|tara:strand:+ start:83 stop:421 length:339 start_codon:yes stop_codon:yes gene_type:complete